MADMNARSFAQELAIQQQHAQRTQADQARVIADAAQQHAAAKAAQGFMTNFAQRTTSATPRRVVSRGKR